KIHKTPKIGLVNGLWASGGDDGTGGLIPIEALTIPSTEKLFLKLTGQQGDVMKESMEVAKTVAWNVIGDVYKKKLSESWKTFGNSGIHIHCPDGATPKDGPSAGGAITTCIISLITGIPVRKDIADIFLGMPASHACNYLKGLGKISTDKNKGLALDFIEANHRDGGRTAAELKQVVARPEEAAAAAAAEAPTT
ncbi:hypothetical protein HOK40_03475, partial [Candidatus Peregrinibacteria bacterium]|nr:hypothetical protein [Candidatus Peregrinibacteria bacterium]